LLPESLAGPVPTPSKLLSHRTGELPRCVLKVYVAPTAEVFARCHAVS
jgi:hypothetical protein